MTRKFKQCMSRLVILVLLAGIVPTAYAAGTNHGEPEQVPSQTREEADPTAPTEPTDPPMDDLTVAGMQDAAVMSVGSTQNSIMLFDYADNGNYTTVLKSQVSCTYKPNGSGTTRTAYIKNLGWHFARYGGVAHADEPLYCIEPWRSYGASTSGNSVDRDVTLDGSGSTSGSNVWYALPAERREAIGLILLYSNQQWNHSVSVTTTKKDSNPNVPLRIATQFLIYEIVCGLRNPNSFILNSTNECGTAGDIFYNAGEASVPYFAPNYNTLVDTIQAAKKIPSFTSASRESAPTITLTGEETAVTDNNGVLASWSFPDGNGAVFSKSGNTLYITQTGTISESTVFKATRNLPSASGSTYSLWYMSGSSYQTTISLENPSNGSLNAYFKLKAVPQTGNLSLIKTTEDGKNLSGWQFGIYSNSSCTSLVSEPHTTDSGGEISVTGLSAGTYYVKELGHTDSAINALYSCASTNPQKVTVTSGGTASVRFQNRLSSGDIRIIKSMPDGGSAAGWKFEVRSGDNSLVGTYTTGEDGTILTGHLLPGEYTVKEMIPEGSAYVCEGANPKTVTVEAGKTAEVRFANRLKLGEISVQKVDTRGNPLAGAEFLLEWSKDGTQWNAAAYADSQNIKEGTCTSEGLADGKLVSGADGTVRFAGLYPGSRYRLTETKAPDGYQILTEPVFEGSIQEKNEYAIQLTVVNAPVFELPMTGSTGHMVQTGLRIAGASVLLAILLYIAFKKRR